MSEPIARETYSRIESDFSSILASLQVRSHSTSKGVESGVSRLGTPRYRPLLP